MTTTKWAPIRWPVELSGLLSAFMTHLSCICWGKIPRKPAARGSGEYGGSPPQLWTFSLFPSSFHFFNFQSHMMWHIRVITIILIFKKWWIILRENCQQLLQNELFPQILPTTCSRPSPLCLQLLSDLEKYVCTSRNFILLIISEEYDFRKDIALCCGSCIFGVDLKYFFLCVVWFLM